MKTDSSVSMQMKAPTHGESPRGLADLNPGSGSQPQEIVEAVGELLSIGRLTLARRLVERALERSPDHAELNRLNRFLDLSEAKPNPTVEPSTEDEIAWLSDPPDSARGRWVALVGRQVVAMTDSIRELKVALRSLDLNQKPLIHRVAP